MAFTPEITAQARLTSVERRKNGTTSNATARVVEFLKNAGKPMTRQEILAATADIPAEDEAKRQRRVNMAIHRSPRVERVGRALYQYKPPIMSASEQAARLAIEENIAFSVASKRLGLAPAAAAQAAKRLGLTSPTIVSKSEQAARLAEAEGITLSEASRRIGIDLSAVSRMAKRLGIKPPPRKGNRAIAEHQSRRAAATWAKLVAGLSEGTCSSIVLSQRTGVKLPTVLRHLNLSLPKGLVVREGTTRTYRWSLAPVVEPTAEVSPVPVVEELPPEPEGDKLEKDLDFN